MVYRSLWHIINSASCKYAHQLKLKPQPAMAVQHWMKRAWFQRIRGGGCQTLVYGGKTNVLPPCLFCHLSCFPCQPLYYFVVIGWGVNGYWWLRQLMFLGVGWQDYQSFSHMPTPPTTAFTPLSHDSILPWSVGASRLSVRPHAGIPSAAHSHAD